jgi:hypothetical protein
MFSFDSTTPINCQVSSVSHIWLVILIGRVQRGRVVVLKVWIVFEIVSTFFHVPRTPNTPLF